MPNQQNFAQELATVQFDQMISGPLLAAIKAQASAAHSTVDFINDVGFNKTGSGDQIKRELITSTFSFKKALPNQNADGGIVNVDQEVSVPLLSMMPVPFIRIESLDIDFNVQLHEVLKDETENTKEIKSDVSFNPWFSSVKFSVSASDRNVSKGSSTVDKQYNLGVKVRAVQDTMPSGLAKVLNIFEELVQINITSSASNPP